VLLDHYPISLNAWAEVFKPSARQQANHINKSMNIATHDQNQSANVVPQTQHLVHYVTPLADVESAEKEYTVRADLPGVDKSNLEITVDNGELTIIGHRHLENPAGDPVYLEIRQADFRRVYELDPAIDTAKITAHIDQGALTLTLPKAEAVKPRKITVD
jgi:HSP20 family protein